ncbi:MAG: hypothetical protein M1816_007389 [Peltula sp. TS41687]|nr:MAG: hypothetical protein M1816_007389 [Peltula sp. TS41687]
MSTNRKVTDFFRPSASQQSRTQRSEIEEDTIQVAQPLRASIAHSKPKDNRAIQGASRGSIAPASLNLSTNDGPRVALRGKLVIKSSDDEGDDSDSSLENLDTLLGISNKPLGSRRKEDVARLSSPELVVPTYKFSLGSLLNQTEKDAAAEADILEARATLAIPDPTAGSPNEPTKTSHVEGAKDKDRGEDGEELLASVVKGQGGQGHLQKIMHAMNRTEALNRPRAWYFFEEESSEIGRQVQICPEWTPSVRWQSMLRDPSLRYQAFITGFAAEMVTRQSYLPDEMVLWILEELCTEERDDLRYSYIEILKSSSQQIQRLLDDTRLVHLFRTLGGSEQAVDVMSTIQPIPQLPNAKGARDTNWTKTVSFIRMLDAVAPHLSTKTIVHTICMLSRLSMDSAVINSADVLQSIERAYTSLLHSIPEQEWESSTTRIRKIIFSSVTHPPFRLRLLESFPMHTALTRLFRHRLALTFLLESTSKIPSSALNIPRLIHHLQTARQFSIHNNTNYADLSAHISLLDICLSAPSQPLTKDEETSFNKDIDALASQMRLMFNRIIDTGASHITRTEAKEVINRVYYRLIYGVRTRQRPKKSIFASGLAAAEDKKDGEEGPLRRLFAKAKEGELQTSNVVSGS